MGNAAAIESALVPDMLQELNRQRRTGDDHFWRRYTFFFELRVPERLMPESRGQFIFPLVFGPDQYSITEPFAVAETETEGSGLYVEEGGIIARTIKISGTTGFKPRSLELDGSTTGLGALAPEERSFGRQLRARVLEELSGQRRFQYLQDSVFRVYADLKRDPATAEDTLLVFHNPQDEESWVVIPKLFEATREKTILYRYDIELLAVRKAESKDRDLSEDSGLLDTMRDAQRMVSSGSTMVQGAINDVSALVQDVTGAIKSVAQVIGVIENIAQILDDAALIVESTTNFIVGTVDSILNIPHAFVQSTASLIDTALDSAERLEGIKDMPADVFQKMRTIVDGCDRIAVHPEVFRERVERKIWESKRAQELLRTISKDLADETEETPPPASLAGYGDQGTAPTAGDVIGAGSELGLGRTVANFTSAIEVPVSQGDTLVGLAARYLGDARLWQYVATLNDLRPPFLDDAASQDLASENSPLPGILGRGDKILVPSRARAPSDLPLLPVLGVAPEESAEDHLLGTDFALEVVSGRPGAPVYDVPVDIAGGSIGPKLVSGLDCLEQDLRQRVTTEQGTDILYRRLGLGRVVGVRRMPVVVEAVRLKISEALDQDPRIAAVRRVEIDPSLADGIDIDIEVEVRGSGTVRGFRVQF